MKFLQAQAFNSKNSNRIDDFIDSKIITALPQHHQQVLNKLIASDSSHLDKFFNKLSANQVYLNHDQLMKILDKLYFQLTLPLYAIEEHIPENNYEISPIKEINKMEIWFDLQKKLNIWSNYSNDSIYQMLKLVHSYIESDEIPVFKEIKKQNTPSFFWKRKTKIDPLSYDIVFKFIYEKFKYFHWDLLPQTKRPMDLFELFCPIEDAALEKKIIHFNDNQVSFFRALNASALIYSAIFSFAPAIPELVAQKIQLNQPKSSVLLYEKMLKDPKYQAIYGTHLYLNPFNEKSFYMGLNDIFKFFIKEYSNSTFTQDELIEPCLSFLLNPNSIPKIQQFFANQTSRLIFIFNRLTSLGFLLRSPLLKGLGYHPLINTDVPNRIASNFEIFIPLLSNASSEEQYFIIRKILSLNSDPLANSSMKFNRE